MQYAQLVTTKSSQPYHFFSCDRQAVLKSLGKDKLLDALRNMLLIRQFEQRAEAAYQQGKIGGFFHSYVGQEAIQVGALAAMGKNHWFITTYRCHALALLLGATPDELMAELFGRATGNAKGRGGSMHFFTERLLGGFGIVGGHLPIAIGAAFSLKYQNIKDQVAICFLGDGAVAQGAVHESLNLASLWNLPCIFVIENNQWGMGTAVKRALSTPRLAEDLAPAYGMQAYTIDGTDFFACYAAFKEIVDSVCKTGRPVLVEAIAERHRGHSISDPGLYRTKDAVKKLAELDPIRAYEKMLVDAKIVDESRLQEMEKDARAKVVAAVQFADESPWPDPTTLEDDVLVGN